MALYLSLQIFSRALLLFLKKTTTVGFHLHNLLNCYAIQAATNKTKLFTNQQDHG